MTNKPVGGSWPAPALLTESDDPDGPVFEALAGSPSVDANGGAAAVVYPFSRQVLGDETTTRLAIAYATDAGFGAPQELAGDVSGGPGEPTPQPVVTIDPSGVATAIWQEGTFADEKSIHTATGAGSFTEHTLDTFERGFDSSAVTIDADDDGTVLAAWMLDTGTQDDGHSTVRGAIRPPGGSFGAAETLTAPDLGGGLSRGGPEAVPDSSSGFDSDGRPTVLFATCFEVCTPGIGDPFPFLASRTFREAPEPAPTQHTLTVERNGAGTGTVTGSGISCGADCSEAYDEGTAVTLEATPAAGSQFTGWSGCDSTPAGDCVVAITAARAVSATFDPASAPDGDGDGVPNSSDVCPEEAGPASNSGCPEASTPTDGDGDGVPDTSDNCPAQAGPAFNNGCPVTELKPPNDIELGKPKLNDDKGTAKLPVEVPGPGELELSAKGVKPVLKEVSGPGTVNLPVKPKGKVADKLEDKGKAKVELEITFTPTGGDPNSDSKSVTLKED
jgi:hypothetical protein